MESKNSQLEKTEKNRTKILKKLLGSKIVWGVVCFVLPLFVLSITIPELHMLFFNIYF